MNSESRQRVAVVGGARTPFAEAGTEFKEYSALAFANHSVNGVLEKLDLDPADVDQLAYDVVSICGAGATAVAMLLERH